VAGQIEANLDMYDQLSMRNKTFTHMMSKVTLFGRHIGFTLKPIKIFFSRTAGQIEGKLHTNIPQAMGVQRYSRIIIDVTWFGSRIGLRENL